MKILVILLLLMGSVVAQDNPLKGLKVDKAQMEQTIDMMVKSGRISKEEGNKAKAELKKMKDSDIDALNAKAMKLFQESQKSGKNSKEVQEAMDLLKTME